MGPAPALTFEQFCAALAESMGIDVSESDRDVPLVDGLGLDSLDLFELLLVIEDLGAEIGEEDLVHIDSLGAAYHWYSVKVTDE